MEGGCERALSAAASCSPPGLSAPAGAAGTGGHAGVTLAAADSEVQDFSLGSAQLQPGLDTCAARTVVLAPLKTFAGLQTDSFIITTRFLSGPVASSLPPSFLLLPEEGFVAGEFMAALRSPP